MRIIEGNIEGICSYYVPWHYSEKLNPKQDMVDLIVELEQDKGRSYRTDLTTPGYIQKRMEKDKATGESADGSYFPESKILIVEEISKECIEKVLKDLIKGQCFHDFFGLD